MVWLVYISSTDDAEAQAGLDTGEYDVPLVIQDRTFDANNQFVYLSGGMPMMGMMQGFLGNRILVNGKPDYVQTLAPGTYRFRLYNGSQCTHLPACLAGWNLDDWF